MGRQWADFDFQKSTLLVQRGVVHGRVDDVKTEYFRDVVPIAPELAQRLLARRENCYPTAEGWLFANPQTEKPYHQEEIQKRHLRAAAKASEATDEARLHFDHHERLRFGNGGQQAARSRYGGSEDFDHPRET